MQTEHENYIREAAETIYELLQDDNIRKQCEARQKYLDRQRTTYSHIDKAKEQRLIAEEDVTKVQKQIDSLNEFISAEECSLAILKATLANKKDAALKPQQ